MGTGAGLEQATEVGCSSVEENHIWSPVVWARDASAMAHPPCPSSSADQTFMMFTAPEHEGSGRILASQVEMSLFASKFSRFSSNKALLFPIWLAGTPGWFFLLCHQRCGVDFLNRMLLIQSHFLKKNRPDYLFRA